MILSRGKKLKSLGLFAALGFFVFETGAGASPSAPDSKPSPSPSAAAQAPLAPSGASGPSGVASPQVSGSPAPSGPAKTITQQEAAQLLRAFQRAQRNEMAALDHRHKFEIKELKASQSARLKEWEAREKGLRHQFFAEHPKGPDRRQYVQDYLKRRDVFRFGLRDEMKTRKNDQDVRRKSLVEEQKQNLREFREIIAYGEKPPERLWPRAGG